MQMCRPNLTRAMAGIAVIALCAMGACATTRSGQPSGPPGRVSDRSAMVRLPAVTFKMGFEQGETDESPSHMVSLAAVLLDRTEVTNRDYQSCVDANVCGPARSLESPALSGADQPVVGVSWYDADKFCRWAEKRLPTEAEFERAARGEEGRAYPWGPKYDASRANTRGIADGYEKTAPVGSFAAGVSKEGPLQDLCGNAAEWVADWYDPSYYRSQEEWENPQGPDAVGGDKVVKGGSWADSDFQSRAAARNRLEVNNRSTAVGFRCAADAEG